MGNEAEDVSEPTVKSPITGLLSHMEFAMYAEGISPETAMAVLNRLLFGSPHAPAGGKGAQPSVFPEGLMPGEELFSAAEVRHIGVPVEPSKTAIVFGADAREVLPGEERPLHPLTSQCRCGRQITRLTGDGDWEHSD
jgi:hypothetical protein